MVIGLAIGLGEDFVEFFELCCVHLGQHLSNFGHFILVLRVHLGQDVFHCTFSVLVIIGKLSQAHVDVWVHGHHAKLLLRDALTELSQELFGVLNADLRQEVGEVLDGLFLLGFESFGLDLSVDLSKVLRVVVDLIIVLGTSLSFFISIA